MAELFTNPITSMTEAYKGTTAMLEDINASADLKTATEQTPVEKVLNEEGKPIADKPVDMFKVNSLAAQMSAARGDTRSADKFQKQAGEYKKTEVENQLSQLKLEQERLESFEQQVQMVSSKEEMKDMILSDSKMNQNQKLRYVATLESQGLDKFKETLQSVTTPAKDRTNAAIKLLHEQNLAADKKMQREIQLQGLRIQALTQQGLAEDRENRAWDRQQRLISDVDHDIKDLRQKQRDLTVKRERGGLSEEEAKAVKVDEANVNEEIRQLELRKRELRAGRTGKPEAAKQVPSEDDWITAAKKANPDVTEAELRDFYKKNYGNKKGK